MHGARGLATFSRTPSGLACGAARRATRDRATRWRPLVRPRPRLPNFVFVRLLTVPAAARPFLALCMRPHVEDAAGARLSSQAACDAAALSGTAPRPAPRPSAPAEPMAGVAAVHTDDRYRYDTAGGGRRMVLPRRLWCGAVASSPPRHLSCHPPSPPCSSPVDPLARASMPCPVLPCHLSLLPMRRGLGDEESESLAEVAPVLPAIDRAADGTTRLQLGARAVRPLRPHLVYGRGCG